MRLKDKVALLTAAAGAGIGQTTARVMAREGAAVVITDMHEDRARAVAVQVAKEYEVKTGGSWD